MSQLSAEQIDLIEKTAELAAKNAIAETLKITDKRTDEKITIHTAKCQGRAFVRGLAAIITSGLTIGIVLLLLEVTCKHFGWLK